MLVHWHPSRRITDTMEERVNPEWLTVVSMPVMPHSSTYAQKTEDCCVSWEWEQYCLKKATKNMLMYNGRTDKGSKGL